MSVLPQITYGNMALIFHGYNKNEIFPDYWIHRMFPDVTTFSVINMQINIFSKKKIDFF
jgi:hypothetical protein